MKRAELEQEIEALGLDEMDSITVFHILRSKWDWAGTIFTGWDIESEVDCWLDDEYDEEQRARIVQHVKNGKIWNKWMIEALCLEGAEVLDDAIREAIRDEADTTN